ncbi:MAG: glycosyltransferase [Rhodobacteraceae bacterium]|nr:glycosyltransferase [Paracoccaceae bacterium]
MAEGPTVSLIIVSRQRPEMLARCLTAVAQMDHPSFEVVVVADPAGLAVAEAWPVKRVAFDARNISAARNCGIAAAAGEVVAFIDDDAVPEPLWLRRLCAPFADPGVGAAGGFVVGWNGISFEWTSGTVDRLLVPGPLTVPGAEVSLHKAQPGRAIEIKGVNCAYRRADLARIGGFDPLLRYYLDETEVNLRLARAGGRTAIVPLARVHHQKAASDQRRADRTPVSLYDIGFSSAVTLRRHDASADEMAAARARMLAHEEGKLAQLRQARRIGASEAVRLTEGLQDGFAEGQRVALPPLVPLAATGGALLPFPAHGREVVILAGRVWQGGRLRAQAQAQVAQGRIVRLYLFSPTALFHQQRFQDGYWCQTGGLFGKSDRRDPLFRLWRFQKRLAREAARFLSGFRYS